MASAHTTLNVAPNARQSCCACARTCSYNCSRPAKKVNGVQASAALWPMAGVKRLQRCKQGQQRQRRLRQPAQRTIRSPGHRTHQVANCLLMALVTMSSLCVPVLGFVGLDAGSGVNEAPLKQHQFGAAQTVATTAAPTSMAATITASIGLASQREGGRSASGGQLADSWQPSGRIERVGAAVNESLILIAGDSQQQQPAKINSMRRLLVRQLANLIMNHEPEAIAESMEGTRVSGTLVSEAAAGRELASDTAQGGRPDEATGSAAASLLLLDSESSVGGGDDDSEGSFESDESAGQEAQQNGQDQLVSSTANSEEAYVTCSPDYDDSTMADANTGANLTAEQQQQLLAGADLSGLLGRNNTSGNQNGLSDEQLQQVTPRAPGGQCYVPGARMIEVITKVITPILFSIIIVVGLLGNIIVMLVILEERKTERELTPTAWDYSVGHWMFGPLWCKFNQYLIVVCALSSIYTLVLMSVDRFMAIVYPIECMSYRTSTNTLHAIYIKWIVILLMASPTISMHGLIDSPLGPDQYTCRFLADQYNPLHFQIIFFITSYLFPLILIFCLYLSLLNKLWFGSRPHGHKESLRTLESKKKVTWLVAGIVIVFALCWCPIQVMLILMRLKSHKITATYVAIQVFSHTLGYMNSCVNPIVYAFASETFTNSFKRSSLGRFFCLSPHQNDHDRSASNFRTIHNNAQLNHHHHNVNQNSQSLNHILPHNGGARGSATGASVSGRDGVVSQDGGNLSTTVLLMNPQSNSESISNRNPIMLPLEPRDRETQLAAVVAMAPDESSIGQRYDSATMIPLEQQHPQRQQPSMIPATPVTSTSTSSVAGSSASGSQSGNRMLAKRKLVAHVVQSGNQVSHRCEPCYQQEMMTP